LCARGARQRRKYGGSRSNLQKLSAGKLHDETPRALVGPGPLRSLAYLLGRVERGRALCNIGLETYFAGRKSLL
jgi:hypothetical protein